MTDADIEDITFSKSDIDFIRPELLSWYRANRRKFPWRGEWERCYRNDKRMRNGMHTYLFEWVWRHAIS